MPLAADFALTGLRAADLQLTGLRAADFDPAGVTVPSPLLTNLAWYFKFDEAAGATAVDATGALADLAAANSPGTAAGKLGTARTFTAASSQNFSGPSSPFVLTSASAWTIGGWVYITDLSISGTLFTLADVSGTRQALIRFLGLSGQVFSFSILNSANSAITVNHSLVASVNTWYHVILSYDPVADQALGYVNNASPVTMASATLATAATPKLYFGSNQAPASYSSCRLDGWGGWTEVLDSDKRALWYNGGSGSDHPF